MFDNTIVEARSLKKVFGGGVQALSDLSFSVREGEIFGLVGPDGAGKSTALRILAAVMDPTSGEATILGHDVMEASSRVHEVGYLSQQFGLYPDLTVMENIEFYADLYGVSKSDRGKKADDLLTFSNLSAFKNRLAGKLSGGMKQKLGLVCSLIHSPKVLLLDEPTNGVDPVSRRDFWKILGLLLRERVTTVISTAYLDEAERCSRVAFLNKGRMIALGTPRELKQLIKGALLEIQLPNPRRIASLLRSQLPELKISVLGDRIHLLSIAPEQESAAVAAVLASGGLKAVELRRIEPSLEDVFVSVLSETTR